MGFLENAQIIIPEITGVAMTIFEDDPETYRSFEEKFCFSPSLQPLYTEQGLRRFFETRDENSSYHVTDALGIRCALFQTNGKWVLLGPYVTEAWNEGSAKTVLASHGEQESSLFPFKTYWCSLPLTTQTDIQSIMLVVIGNSEAGIPSGSVRIDLDVKKSEDLPSQNMPVFNSAETVSRNYAWEMDFMEAIRQGDGLRATKMMEGIGSAADKPAAYGIRFLTNSMRDRVAGAFALRVLVRHAAIQAGVPLVFVDALSQEYAQKMHTARTENQLNELIREYVISFCRAVRKNTGNTYSPYVRKAIQYIELQLNQPIDAELLSGMNGITRQYFSQIFKKETGKTVKQYIMQARCDRAAELLESSSLPIQEISHYVGYDDTNYFARVFRSLYGISPQEYRKQKSF